MFAAAAALFSLAVPAAPTVVTEPKTGVTFAMRRSATCRFWASGGCEKTFLKFKVYAVGLYVADSALSGPLAAFTGGQGRHLRVLPGPRRR